MITARIRFTLALGIALTKVLSAIAQESSPTAGPKQNPTEIQVLDQLIEQNEQLEKQNQQMEQQNQQLRQQNEQLMEQIKGLRARMAKPNNGQEQAAEAASVPATGGQKVEATAQSLPSQSTQSATQNQSTQSSSPNQSVGDDKTLYPEASQGNSAIFGEFNPGRGFTVGRSKLGELNLSGYVVARYLNQLPANQTATDHLGRPLTVTPRQDFQFHRVMLFSQGWLFNPKFEYSTFLWTVQDTNQVAVGGALYYDFGKYMTLGMGWNAYPGTQSLQGSHPYWESYDRVMADEFFRPYFSQGVFAKGNVLPKLEYRWMIGNNLSNLDVPATAIDRGLSAGGALTWLPTTGEFGPRGAFGDYEDHQSLATRFNLAYTYSPEDRQSPIGSSSGNTTIRLADSLNIFDPGALANGVTVENVRYQLLSAAAGMKQHGFWLQGEGYARKLDDFVATGKLPASAIRDFGFYVQLADMVVQKRFELYAATSYIFGHYGHPKEFLGGGNYYPWNTRNIRINTQLIYAFHSPVNSTFGFYEGGLTGPIFSFGVTALY
jgi:DNA-binding transcriptional MerR regulator